MGATKKEENMNEIVKQEPSTPAKLLELAVSQNLDIDKLERLMEMQVRWEEKEARQAFYEAKGRLQEMIPVLKKTKKVKFPSKSGGSVDYSYAPLSDIVEQLKKLLAEYGFSYEWKIADTTENISVTFIFTHKAGHCEKNTMSAPADATGGKNLVQQKASTVTYLQRYTMIGGIGIATADDDINARLNPPAFITEEQVANIQALIDEVGGSGETALFKWLKIGSIDAIPANKYDQAVAGLEKRRKK